MNQVPMNNKVSSRMDETKFNYRQLTLAREFNGLSQSELAQKIKGLSQPNLSKFEKGFGGLSKDILELIILELNFPKQFYSKRITNYIEHAHYRKRSTITKKIRLELNTNMRILGFIVDNLSKSLEWPDYNLSYFDVEAGYSPEYIARYIRKQLGIAYTEPISDIYKVLESNGILVIEYDAKTDKFDGVSFKTDDGIPVVIVNKNFPNDRKRFTLAHELGHLLMHIINESPISEERDREKEADRFASEFLMPEEGISHSLKGLKLSNLYELKTYWLTSMASIVYRAKSLKCITPDRSKYLNIELSRRGYRKNEPYSVYIDKPTLFNLGFKMHKDILKYSKDEFEQDFALSYNVLSNYFDNNSSKLKVVRD